MTSTITRLVYINGRILPETEACISIRDQGLVYGDSVFDTARTFNGKIFMLEAHVERLSGGERQWLKLRHGNSGPGHATNHGRIRRARRYGLCRTIQEIPVRKYGQHRPLKNVFEHLQGE